MSFCNIMSSRFTLINSVYYTDLSITLFQSCAEGVTWIFSFNKLAGGSLFRDSLTVKPKLKLKKFKSLGSTEILTADLTHPRCLPLPQASATTLGSFGQNFTLLPLSQWKESGERRITGAPTPNLPQILNVGSGKQFAFLVYPIEKTSAYPKKKKKKIISLSSAQGNVSVVTEGNRSLKQFNWKKKKK